MNALIVVIFIIFFLGVVAGLLPRDERPNARVIAVRGSECRAEVTCPTCGARRFIWFTAGMEVAAVVCAECGRNIVPTFDVDCQKLILQAARGAFGQVAAAGEVRRR